MRVAIYGAGAIGSWLGVKLAQAGCEVSVVARGATLDALQLHGLRLEHPATSAGPVELVSVPVRCSANPADLQTLCDLARDWHPDRYHEGDML